MMHVALLLGLFGVPLALLIGGHRIRQRGPVARHAFAGAVAGHGLAACLALMAGMIPPEAWTAGDTLRGLLGVGGLLVGPLLGAGVTILATRLPRRTRRAQTPRPPASRGTRSQPRTRAGACIDADPSA